jgi:hypothetical protein
LADRSQFPGWLAGRAASGFPVQSFRNKSFLGNSLLCNTSGTLLLKAPQLAERAVARALDGFDAAVEPREDWQV